MIPPATTRAKRTKAFSLVEILAGVAIAGVLMVLAGAGFQRAMIAAQSTRNISNHRTIVRALLAYATEHNGRLPWGNDLTNPEAASAYPKTLCRQGYIADGTVFFSPKFWPFWARNEGALLVLKNPVKYANALVPWAYPSYAANRYGAMPTSDEGRKPASLSHVGGDGNLSKLMLLRDVYQPAYAAKYGGGTWWFSTGDATIPSLEDCYLGKVHAAFADGRVEGFARQDMVEMMKATSESPLFREVYTRK